MTCNNADEGCPMVLVQKYDFQSNMTIQSFDGTDVMNEKYTERSLEIASEMYYVFSK